MVVLALTTSGGGAGALLTGAIAGLGAGLVVVACPGGGVHFFAGAAGLAAPVAGLGKKGVFTAPAGGFCGELAGVGLPEGGVGLVGGGVAVAPTLAPTAGLVGVAPIGLALATGLATALPGACQVGGGLLMGDLDAAAELIGLQIIMRKKSRPSQRCVWNAISRESVIYHSVCYQRH